MTKRMKKYVAAATLTVSLGGGGALLATNTGMIASTADAGQPGFVVEDCERSLTNPCLEK